MMSHSTVHLMMQEDEPTVLYRVFGDADLLLYIGISNDFGRRWKQHARVQPWWDEKRRLTVDSWHDSRAEAEAAEEAAIKAEKPKYNKTYNPQALERPVCYWYEGEWWRVIARETGWPYAAHLHLAIQSMSGDVVHTHLDRLGSKHACGRPRNKCRDCPKTWAWPASEPMPVVIGRASGLGWPEIAAKRPRIHVEVPAPVRAPVDEGDVQGPSPFNEDNLPDANRAIPVPSRISRPVLGFLKRRGASGARRDEIIAHTGMPVSTVKRWLAIMRDRGLIAVSGSTKAARYYIPEPAPDGVLEGGVDDAA